MTAGPSVISDPPGSRTLQSPAAIMFRTLVLRRLSALTSARLSVTERSARWMCGGADPAPCFHVAVRNPRFWRCVALGGSIGAAEAYMRGWWTTDDLGGLLRAFAAEIPQADALETGTGRLGALVARIGHLARPNSRRGARRNIIAHYDLGNDFFALFLDPTLSYSSALFESPQMSLEDAQIAKIDRLCRKLDLRPGQHLLEIGTGWGAMAIHAARYYGCLVTTTTISREQHALASERVRRAGLADRVRILLDDYRDLRGRFDRIVSVEMIEAVGHRNLPRFFGACGRLLLPGGAMGLQVITTPDHRYERYRRSTDFIQAWIFPGSCVPSLSAMTDAMRRTSDLRVLHLEEFGAHYAATLARWCDRFLGAAEELRVRGFTDAFIRCWEWYFRYCEAGFTAGTVGVQQIVLARPGATIEPARLPPLPAAPRGAP